MSSNSLIFKATIYPEWFSDRIQPWVHYIPIQVDYSDLYDTFVFFRGDLKGEGNHDQMAKKIALEGKKWVETFWRNEDATAYMFRCVFLLRYLVSEEAFLAFGFSSTIWGDGVLIISLLCLMIRLFLEYARVMSSDREALTYKPRASG
jgi:hypothetical protein